MRQLHRIQREVVRVITPELIQPRYRRADCAVAGACYIVSEAIYHLGGRDAGFEPKRVQLDGVTHWWLEHRTDGRIHDGTASQFDAATLNRYYAAGKFGGFLTREPSRRAAELIRRVTARRLHDKG